MEGEYHNLVLFERIDEAALEIPRAKALCAAIHRYRDSRLVDVMRTREATPGYREALVFELDCEQVPSQNAAGIRYRERLALVISRDETDIPEAVPLRKTFPELMHRNRGLPGHLPSLCLYYSPKPSVLRTWTPQSHLRRIQWWLEGSARGELHPADQPVEQLFFDTQYELLLPWNVDTLAEDTRYEAAIELGAERPSGGATFRLKYVERTGGARAPKSVAHVEVSLPPVVHGSVELNPQTLGALADILQARGVDLPAMLRAKLRERIPPAGVTAESDEDLAIILLRISIARDKGSATEHITRKGFFTVGGVLALGKALGAYFYSDTDRRYFTAAGLIGQAPPDDWRKVPLGALEVLQQNTPAMARSQSGIDDEGPAGVLVGAGSLGATMLGLWGRSGWGSWTVIDHDHIKPHNLSRHPARGLHVGRMKAEVVSELHGLVMQGASTVRGVCADACDFDAVKMAMESAQIVVDASTTLEYPRIASTRDDVQRHASVFLTPDGNSSVMLVEDEKRGLRLRTLEAQYYRAVIDSDWGKSHLDGNLSYFFSGASCRDLSVKLPYSKLTAHAATLAEQVRNAVRTPNALIRIWHRDPANGAVAVHSVDPHLERRLSLGEYELFVDEGVLERLRSMRAKRLPNETGGVLLGYYDLNLKSIVIVDALAAPNDSKSSREGFERGVSGLKEAIREASRRTAGIVRYIGEWHSHPAGHRAHPSADDGIQLEYLALHMAEDGLPAVQLIVGEGEFCILKATLIE